MDDVEAIRRKKVESARLVFPLALSPFEKYLVWDDSPQIPLTFFVELHFSKPLNPSKLQEAIDFASMIHPLFRSRVVAQNSELFWDFDETESPKVVVANQREYLLNGHLIPIDLTSEFGIRFWIENCEDVQKVFVQVHHACSDGVGFRPFLMDVFFYYANFSGDSQSRPIPLRSTWDKFDTQLLPSRFDFSQSFDGEPRIKLTSLQRLKNAHYFHFQPPKPLRADVQPASDDVHATPLCHTIFDTNLTEQISNKALDRGYSVNEIGLAFLFLTCARWNEQRGDTNHKSRLRLLMSYDLRSRIDFSMPATNRMSFSFLGRTAGQSNDLSNLIRTIQLEVKAIQDSRLPLDLINALAAGVKFPRLCKWVLRHSPNMATAVLTYAGDVWRGANRHFAIEDNEGVVGDARLTKILAAPPVRRNTNIALGLCFNMGQLCISAAWNRHAMSYRECQEFLNMYRQCWIDWIE